MSDFQFEFEDCDPDNPRQWRTRKRVLTCIGPILSAFVVSLANSIYVGSIPDIIVTFGVSPVLGISGISFYCLGLVFGPILSTAGSEIYGRRTILLISLPLTLLFTIGGALAKNFATIAVMRFLASTTASPCLTVSTGVINDVWDISQEKIGTLILVLFGTSIIWAPEIGPTIGISIVEARGWQWSFWLTAILLGFSILIILPTRETFKSEILRRRAKKNGQLVPPRGDLQDILVIAITRPLHMLFFEPLVLSTSIVIMLNQGIVFCIYIAFPVMFTQVYGFTTYQAGLTFLSIFVGSVLGLPIFMVIHKAKYEKEQPKAAQEGQKIDPENHLYPALLGVVLMPISLFWLAWTAHPSIHWAVPLLSGVVFGAAFFLVGFPLPIYKNDVYQADYGASAFASDVIMRYLFSAATPLFTMPMIDRVGFGWAISILAFLTVLQLPLPWLIFRYGLAMRRKSSYVVDSGDLLR